MLGISRNQTLFYELAFVRVSHFVITFFYNLHVRMLNNCTGRKTGNNCDRRCKTRRALQFSVVYKLAVEFPSLIHFSRCMHLGDNVNFKTDKPNFYESSLRCIDEFSAAFIDMKHTEHTFQILQVEWFWLRFGLAQRKPLWLTLRTWNKWKTSEIKVRFWHSLLLKSAKLCE